ncbi:hypothetical protein [Paracoccus sp. S3-43]|uniref:hypothetical protein n=1 Tax=Paracoccus sp. S3-43 TaxID=3030011 RepID=UPI0023AFB1C4|nr:hypothetical protein [Paracoccus sp. S3-43]WEF22878.1 hypothetical protein PXD02_08420 [Paracoccus sp. S3-43]
MTNGILSKLINEIGEAQADARTESYSMVNVRPGDKVAAMLDLLSKLAGKSPSALITDEISRRLADYAASATINADAIMDAAEHALERENAYGFQEGSALDYLQKAGILEIEDPIKKQMREILISPKKN